MDNELLLFDRVNVIKDTINKYGEENFYLSFSGGKDSTILHNLLDEALPNNKIPRLFLNTGIEYAHIVSFVKELAKNDERVIIYNSGVNIKEMLEKKGYPFKSKEHSRKLCYFQKSGMLPYIEKYLNGMKDDKNKSHFACPRKLKYQFTKEFTIPISDECCYQLKKYPAHKYENESGRTIAILGLRTSEGGERANHLGCIVLDGDKPKKFKPLNPMSEEWEEWYIKERNIKLCDLYYPPFNYKRTGCKGCPYSLNLEEQLDVMERLLPSERKQCEQIWKPVYEEYRRIGYRLKKQKQMTIDDYMEM